MPWINHLPPVCWSTFGILVWNDSGYVNLTQWWYFFIIFEYILHISTPHIMIFCFPLPYFPLSTVLYFLLSTLVLTLYIDVVLSLSILTDICHDNPLKPDVYFVAFTLLFFALIQKQRTVTDTHGVTYWSLLDIMILFFHYFLIFAQFIFYRKSLTLPCHLHYQKLRENSERFKRYFLVDHVRKRTFVTSSTILQTATARKVD